MADFDISAGKWGKVPSAEIEDRITRTQAALVKAGVDAAIIIQKADLFYLTGTIQQGQLVLPAEGEPLFLVTKDYERARYESPLENIQRSSGLRDVTSALNDLGVPEKPTLGMELDVVPVSVFRRYEALVPGVPIKDCSPLLRDVRSVKSAYEISLMDDAAEMVDLAVKAGTAVLKEGMTEVELSAHCDFAMRRAGHQGLVRFRSFGQEWAYGHVFAGPSAALPASPSTPLGGPGVSPAVGNGAGWRPIQRGEPVIIDIAACAGGYLVDQTRIISLGPIAQDLVEGYELCMQLQQTISERAKSGAVPDEIYQEAVDWMTARVAESGLGAYFMGAPDNQVAFIGHGLGIELDEPPFITWGARQPLREGQVFACEPKLIFPDRAAVGIENTWRVTDEGLVSITFSSEELLQI